MQHLGAAQHTSASAALRRLVAEGGGAPLHSAQSFPLAMPPHVGRGCAMRAKAGSALRSSRAVHHHLSTWLACAAGACRPVAAPERARCDQLMNSVSCAKIPALTDVSAAHEPPNQQAHRKQDRRRPVRPQRRQKSATTARTIFHHTGAEPQDRARRQNSIKRHRMSRHSATISGRRQARLLRHARQQMIPW